MSENIGCLGSILNALGLLPKQNNKQSKKIENIFLKLKYNPTKKAMIRYALS